MTEDIYIALVLSHYHPQLTDTTNVKLGASGLWLGTWTAGGTVILV